MIPGVYKKGDAMDNIVELRGVTKIYGEKENQVLALHNINLEIERGSMVSQLLSMERKSPSITMMN